jgi:hypothetical protein
MAGDLCQQLIHDMGMINEQGPNYGQYSGPFCRNDIVAPWRSPRTCTSCESRLRMRESRKSDSSNQVYDDG